MNEKFSDVLTDDERKMSLEEKLDCIDREIRLLHKFCLESGYHPRQIEKSAEPFITASISSTRKKRLRMLMGLSVIVAIFAALVYVDPVYRLMVATGRKASIKILPIWDWSQYWNAECFVDNPLYSDVTELTENDCQVCSGMKSLERVTNITADSFAKDYLENEIPVIVTDGTRDWPDEIMLTIEKLNHIYTTHPVLRQYVGCGLRTNKDAKHKNHKILLQQLVKSKEEGFIAHWENCLKEPAKAFREFYRRPYFLSDVVQLSETNWVFISSSFELDKNEQLEIPVEMPSVMIIQVKGETEILLHPRVPCDEKCDVIADVLREGEIIYVPLADFLWSMEYRTMPLEENVAIGIGAIGNEIS